MGSSTDFYCTDGQIFAIFFYLHVFNFFICVNPYDIFFYFSIYKPVVFVPTYSGAHKTVEYEDDC